MTTQYIVHSTKGDILFVATVHNGTIEESLLSITDKWRVQRVWEVTPQRVEALKKITLHGLPTIWLTEVYKNAVDVIAAMLDEVGDV